MRWLVNPPVLVVLVLGVLGLGVGASPLLLVDNARGEYLHHGDDVAFQADDLSSLVSAIAGLLPPGDVHDAAIGLVLRPMPLKKPRAHVALNVASLSQDELAEIFGSRRVRTLHMENQAGHPVETVAAALSDVAASNAGVTVTMLDQRGLQDCHGNCLDEHVEAAAASMGATVSDSAVLLPGGARLDLDRLPDKLFVVEAASLHSGVQAQLQAADARSPAPLLEVTLVGLHGLETAHGADSDVARGARAALLAMLKNSVARLDEHYGGDVTYQAAVFDMPSGETVVDVMKWKSTSRRQLAVTALGEQWPPADQEQASKMFTVKAAAYGGFLIILYFALAGVWCLCNMPFKQDTMLFGAKKYE